MGVSVREHPPGSGKWYVFINHNKKRFAKCVGTKAAALKVREKLQAKLTLGEFGLADAYQEQQEQVPTFGQYKQHFLAVHACKHTTKASYEMNLRKHLSVFDTKPLDEITKSEIRELINDKLQDELDEKGEKVLEAALSSGTVGNIIAAMRAVFTLAIEEEIVKDNPAKGLGKHIKKTAENNGELPDKEVDFLSRDEVALMLQTAKTYNWDVYTTLLCAVRTGLRAGELWALQFADIDFNGCFVKVSRNFVRGRETTPKSGKTRRVDMSKQLAEAFQELARRRKKMWFNVRLQAERMRGEEQYEDSIHRSLAITYGITPEFVRTVLKLPDPPPWCFISEAGSRIVHNNFVRRVFNPLLGRAGLRKIRFHDLRHTFASLLLQQGESPQYVKDQMGHHSIQITVDIYGHLIPGANRRAVDALDDPEQPAATSTQLKPSLHVVTA